MSIYYCAIANEKSIVCQKSIANRSYEDIVRDYLGRNPPDQEFCFSQGDVSFHCITVSGMSFIAATDIKVPRAQGQSFIQNLSANFLKNQNRVKSLKSGPEGCLDHSYGPILQDYMAKFSTYRPNSQLDALRNNVSAVTETMQENTREMLKRGERLDNLVNKTSDMEANADRFQMTTTKVAQKARCENMRMKFIIIGVVGGLILIILLIILWQTGVFSSGKK